MKQTKQIKSVTDLKTKMAEVGMPRQSEAFKELPSDDDSDDPDKPAKPEKKERIETRNRFETVSMPSNNFLFKNDQRLLLDASPDYHRKIQS